ncbi:MAG: VOC family protein [Armatimonadetes bacterium]|jgi:predicted enzyme related to lactoylglutathione lyase|nr:VOC family protein [Armatimonadota bacterium]
MPRVIHFELPADDPERAVRFYREVFGWMINKWEGPFDYWLVMTGDESEPGIDGGIMRRTDAAGTRNTIGVSSVDEYVAKIEAAGGKVVAPKTTVPGVGYLAYCEDPEGNLFGLLQEDRSVQ